MRDSTFFTKLLALDRPWRVRRVDLDIKRCRIDLWLVHRRNASFTCPDCGHQAPLRDHATGRAWRHLDHGACATWLQANLPRVTYPAHGVRRVRVPWAPPGSRFTIAFERHAIDVLRETDVLGGARLLHVSWDEAWNIMERAVARGMRAKKRRVIAHLGVDEKAVAKRHRYVTLVCDLDRSTVEYIADDRKQTSLDAYFQSLTPRQLAGIEAVAMDMWDPFALEARRRGGPDDREAPGQRADVRRSSDHQRYERRAELEDSNGQKNAYGFRNREHLKTAISFHRGGLKLYPPERCQKP